MFYILATYNTIHSTYLLPIHCLYTTYITRLQIDRHYLCTTYICTTYILPHSTCVPLIWMRQLLYIHIYSPYGRCNSLPTRTHTTGERVMPWTHCIRNHPPTPTGGEPRTWKIDRYIYAILIYTLSIYTIIIHMYTKSIYTTLVYKYLILIHSISRYYINLYIMYYINIYYINIYYITIYYINIYDINIYYIIYTIY